MTHEFPVRDFYLLLKLGIWKSGYVNNWGVVKLLNVFDNIDDIYSNTDNLIYSDYWKQKSFFEKRSHKLICNNIYLINLLKISESHIFNESEYQYLLYLKVNHAGIVYQEKIYCLKITSKDRDFDIDKDKMIRKRKKLYRRRK